MKTTKTFLLLIVFSILALFNVQAQTPGFEWATQATGETESWGYSISTDPSGNVITTGHFFGTVDFDPGAGVYNLTSNGDADIFIQKLDVNGNLLWATSMGSTAADWGWSLVTDATGNIYVTGWFNYSMDADPGTGTFLLTSQKQAVFVLKLNGGGNLVWAKQMGSPQDPGWAYGYGIALDADQNVITTGSFVGLLDFNPGSGVFNMTAQNMDTFIQKLDPSGNFVWAKQLKGNSTSQSIKTDASGNIYVTGSFSGTVDFNPDPAKKAVYNLTAFGSSDIYIEKLDANGNFVWAKQAGGTEGNYGYSLAISSDGYIYVTGQFFGTADFDPGSGTYNLTSFGESDIFLLKLSLAGNFIWAKQIGGSNWNSGNGVTTDAAGNIYISGFSYATADFNPDPVGTYYLTANGADDLFIYKSDADGNFVWAAMMGGAGHDGNIGITLDGAENIYMTGVFSQTTDFNPSGNETFNLTAVNSYDMFVLKLNTTVSYDCPVPINLTATNITTAAANLGWGAVSGAGGYYVRYREVGSDWIEIPGIVSSSNLSITGLSPLTAYEFQVKTDCYSNYSYSGEFITQGGGCIDNYEPNETMATAATIPVNTDIAALIGTNGDYDWFKFSTTNAGKNIKITLTDLPADYNVRLYKSDGTHIGSSLNPGTTSETIIYNYNKAGTYYVWVYGVGGVYNPGSCYTLKAAVSSTAFKSDETEILSSTNSEELTVYPNPSNTSFNFLLKSDSTQAVKIQIYDLSGRLAQEYNSLSPDIIITVGEDLKPGIYVAVVTQGTNRNSVKLSKVK